MNLMPQKIRENCKEIKRISTDDVFVSKKYCKNAETDIYLTRADGGIDTGEHYQNCIKYKPCLKQSF